MEIQLSWNKPGSLCIEVNDDSSGKKKKNIYFSSLLA
jgi:hypothetical protein